MNCPKCEQPMELGYRSAMSIPWIAPEKFGSFAFTEDDQAATTVRKNWLPSKASYFRSNRCQACEVVVVDHSAELSRKEVEAEIDAT